MAVHTMCRCAFICLHDSTTRLSNVAPVDKRADSQSERLVVEPLANPFNPLTSINAFGPPILRANTSEHDSILHICPNVLTFTESRLSADNPYPTAECDHRLSSNITTSAILYKQPPFFRGSGSRLKMLSQFARSIWTTVAIASVPLLFGLPQTTAKCLNPSVRREWRSFTNNEKAEWITAVKVGNSLTPNQVSAHIYTPQCLGNLPHDDALAPTVNPPDIGPVNISGSYYDDFVYVHMVRSIAVRFRVTDGGVTG